MKNEEFINKIEKVFDRYYIITPKVAFEDMKVIILDKQFGDIKMSFRYSQKTGIIYGMNIINIGIYELSNIINTLVKILEE